MNFVPFVILTFCIQQIFGQDNVRSGDFGKTPRRLNDDRAINYNNNADASRHRVVVEDTPDEFIINKPLKTGKSYDDFLSFLYRGDKAKSKVKRAIATSATANDDVARGKRALIFRPLFVYKQQEIKRQRVKDERNSKNKGSSRPTKPRRG